MGGRAGGSPRPVRDLQVPTAPAGVPPLPLFGAAAAARLRPCLGGAVEPRGTVVRAGGRRKERHLRRTGAHGGVSQVGDMRG